jgi:arginyl-tRNA synthetase
VAQYLYELVKAFNGLYQNVSILHADIPEQVNFRLALTERVGNVLRKGLGLLGIEAPDRM